MHTTFVGRRHLSNLIKLALSAALLAIPAVSFADVIAGNFGPSHSYEKAEGNFAGNDFVGDDFTQAIGFTPVNSGVTSSLILGLNCFYSGQCNNNFTVSLETDSGGQPSGTGLESFTLAGTSLAILGQSASYSTLTLTSTLKPVLVAGTLYWIVVSPDVAGNDAIVWNFNNIGDAISDAAYSEDGGLTWIGGPNEPGAEPTPGAFEVDGTIVPEPSSIGLLLTSGLVLALRLTFRRK
jgi:hypothetical protein